MAQANLGMQYARFNRHAEAIEAHARGRELLDSVVRQNPGVATYRFGLAELEFRLGLARSLNGDTAAAITGLQRSCDLIEGLIVEDPKEERYRSLCSSSACELGRALCNAGQPAEAIPILRRANDRMAELARGHPDDVFAAAELALNRVNLARSCLLAGKLDEAVAAYRQAVADCQAVFGDGDRGHGRESVFAARVGLALSLHATGKDAEAAELATSARALAEGDPDALVQMAGYYASGMSAVVGSDGSAESRRLEYATQAMEALSRAIALGFKDRARLLADPDLAPIRAAPTSRRSCKTSRFRPSHLGCGEIS